MISVIRARSSISGLSLITVGRAETECYIILFVRCEPAPWTINNYYISYSIFCAVPKHGFDCELDELQSNKRKTFHCNNYFTDRGHCETYALSTVPRYHELSLSRTNEYRRRRAEWCQVQHITTFVWRTQSLFYGAYEPTTNSVATSLGSPLAGSGRRFDGPSQARKLRLFIT